MRVAINGIGVGGPTLAYWLRQYGHDPVLFEKAPALRSEGYLIDFWGLGYDIAERMGLLPKLHETCYLMKRLRMVDASGHDDAKLDLAPMREVLRERFFSLARADLARALVEACGDVPAHFGVSLTAIDQDHDGVLATLSNGRQERFDLVVGADGLHSRVRELVFGAEARYERSMGCYVAAFRIPGYPHRDELSYVSHTVPKRHVARVTLRNDETLALLVCRAEVIDGSFPKMSPKEALRRSFGGMRWEVPEILDAMDRAADFYFDRVSQIQLPRWYSGRVGLLGDAAACASLLAGEGTGLAMLAGELHRADGDFARAFESYDARLRSFVTAKQKAALGFRGFFAPQTVLGLKARNALVSALSIGFFAKRILAGQLRDDFELPEYSGTPGAALSGLAPPGAASGA